jgi:hypothetical protein
MPLVTQGIDKKYKVADHPASSHRDRSVALLASNDAVTEFLKVEEFNQQVQNSNPSPNKKQLPKTSAAAINGETEKKKTTSFTRTFSPTNGHSLVSMLSWKQLIEMKNKKKPVAGNAKIFPRSSSPQRATPYDVDRILDVEARGSDGSYLNEDYKQATENDREMYDRHGCGRSSDFNGITDSNRGRQEGEALKQVMCFIFAVCTFFGTAIALLWSIIIQFKFGSPGMYIILFVTLGIAVKCRSMSKAGYNLPELLGGRSGMN